MYNYSQAIEQIAKYFEFASRRVDEELEKSDGKPIPITVLSKNLAIELAESDDSQIMTGQSFYIILRILFESSEEFVVKSGRGGGIIRRVAKKNSALSEDIQANIEKANIEKANISQEN